jgi:hypothetical protein
LDDALGEKLLDVAFQADEHVADVEERAGLLLAEEAMAVAAEVRVVRALPGSEKVSRLSYRQDQLHEKGPEPDTSDTSVGILEAP